VANFTTVQDIVEDALWLAGEPSSSTGQYYTRATNLVSAMQQALVTGGAIGNIVLPAMDWWWAKKRANLTVLPAQNITGYTAIGSITLTKDSTSATLGAACSVDLDYYRIVLDGQREQIPSVASHTAGGTAITLDMAWKPATVVTSNYKLVPLEFALATDFVRFAGPLQVPEWPYEIGITDLASLDSAFPLATITAGTPQLAAMVGNGTKVHLSHYYADGKPRVFEYDYVYSPAALTVGGSDPVVPHPHRRILSFGAALQMLFEKNDDKQAAMGIVFQTAWDAMEKVQIKDSARSPDMGRLIPRPTGTSWGVLRTSSGVIIG